MAMRGSRFHIDLDHVAQGHEQDDDAADQDGDVHLPPTLGFVKDIQERSHVASTSTPTAPTKSNTTGFPAHKKRTAISHFKQKRAGLQATDDGTLQDTNSTMSKPTAIPNASDRDTIEKQQIDQENRQRLAAMSDDEIAREQQELFSTLSPALLEKLLKRSTIEDSSNNDLPCVSSLAGQKEQSTEKQADSTSKKVTFQVPATSDDTGDSESENAPSPSAEINPPAVHFPRPPEVPDLDPSSSTFLDDLHEKYFPDLPADPSKLAWMSDPSTSESTSPYSPSQSSLPVNALRFSFSGALLAPRTARVIPVTQGLHHHGDAPEAAGYTIPELAHLSRSSFPTQRCVAYQTLGRFLYRLGRGQFGADESPMATGLWKCIGQGRVIETLQEEAGQKAGHLSAKAYATEALWLWRRGGGQR